MAAVDPRIAYLDKRKTLEEATDRLDDIVANVRVLRSTIEKWDHVLLPDEEEPFSPTHYGKPTKLLPQEWPTFETFSEALQQWRRARREAEDAYRAVPDPEGLESLPELPSEFPPQRG